MIELEGVGKSLGLFRSREVLRDVNCRIPSDRVVGLLGRNGAGKTTLLRLILGHAWPTRGRIRVDAPAPRRIWLPEGRAIAELGRPLDWARAMELPDLDEELAEGLDVRPLWRRPVRTLSNGQRRLVEIYLTLATDADLVLLDEPTAGLDPVHLEVVKRAVRRRAADGATVVLSTHLIREMEDVVDHVLLLHAGSMLATGDADELRRDLGAFVPVARPAAMDGLCDGVEVVRSEERLIARDAAANAELARRIRERGLPWRPVEPTLHDVFSARIAG